jgi:hypothetical protein
MTTRVRTSRIEFPAAAASRDPVDPLREACQLDGLVGALGQAGVDGLVHERAHGRRRDVTSLSFIRPPPALPSFLRPDLPARADSILGARDPGRPPPD